MPHANPDAVLDARTSNELAAAKAASAAVRATLFVVTDDNGDVWAYAVPDITPTERISWLQSFGIDPGEPWFGTPYAYGLLYENGRFITAGNDEGLKDLLPEATEVYTVTGEEMFRLARR